MKNAGTLVIINPHAGMLNPGAPGPAAVRRLARRRLPGAEIVITENEEHARETVRAALDRGVQTVACAGGDGTARLAAELLAGTGAALGVIPLGSAGNVARALGTPRSPGKALDAIRRGRRASMDVGYVNGTHFLEAAGIGFHADALERYGLTDRKSLVRGAIALAETLAGSEPFAVEIEARGEVIRERVVQVTVSNLPLYGTGFRIAPGASMDDGLLDITIVGERAAGAAPLLLGASVAGTLKDFPGIRRIRARRAAISTEQPLAVHADAEIAGRTPAIFTVEHNHLIYITP